MNGEMDSAAKEPGKKQESFRSVVLLFMNHKYMDRAFIEKL